MKLFLAALVGWGILLSAALQSASSSARLGASAVAGWRKDDLETYDALYYAILNGLSSLALMIVLLVTLVWYALHTQIERKFEEKKRP